MDNKQYIEAGRIVNTHGIAGEVKIEVWLDSADFMRRFSKIYIQGEEKKVISSRAHKNFLLAKLEGVDDVNAAMRLKGRDVYVDKQEAKLPKGAFFIQDIIGAQVLDVQGETVGILTEVMETPASRVYVVKGEKEHLIPAVPEFIMSTDPEAKIITVSLIEGM